MITSITFLQDLPIPQNGAPVSRVFYASEGWGLNVVDESGYTNNTGRTACIVHADGRSFTLHNIGFIVHRQEAKQHEQLTPVPSHQGHDPAPTRPATDDDGERTAPSTAIEEQDAPGQSVGSGAGTSKRARRKNRV